MNLQFKIKPFAALSPADVYSILQLRSEVFVVEQNCVYQDIDGKDEKALHVAGYDGDGLVAYARLFPPGYYFENAAIGRVVVRQDYRTFGLGHRLMEVALNAVEEHYSTTQVTISAQLYLKKFYESHGFVQEGDVYPEDGIPHIKMHRQ